MKLNETLYPTDAGAGYPPAFSDSPRSAEATELSESWLEDRRVLGHRVGDPRTKPYDMLRTQALQALDLHKWHILGITSPTMGCGKTLTSINLALSVARQTERSVLLVDMDLRKPQVAHRLGVETTLGLVDVLNGRATLSDAVFDVRAGHHEIRILPTSPSLAAAELMASRSMRAVIQDLRTHYRDHLVILDLPPMLVADDVLSILPGLDAVLLVTAVGSSTVADVEECGRHLQGTNLIKIVVNKVPEVQSVYY
jgi:protein-tyrosine kinase